MDELLAQSTGPCNEPHPLTDKNLAQAIGAPARLMDKLLAHNLWTSRETTFNTDDRRC